jgi:hypothetical protein
VRQCCWDSYCRLDTAHPRLRGYPKPCAAVLPCLLLLCACVCMCVYVCVCVCDVCVCFNVLVHPGKLAMYMVNVSETVCGGPPAVPSSTVVAAGPPATLDASPNLTAGTPGRNKVSPSRRFIRVNPSTAGSAGSSGGRMHEVVSGQRSPHGARTPRASRTPRSSGPGGDAHDAEAVPHASALPTRHRGSRSSSPGSC